MPDNWKDYDLVVIKDERLLTVSVKTRENSKDGNPHFRFKKQDKFHWIVMIDSSQSSDIKAWIPPKSKAVKIAYKPKPKAKDQNTLSISLKNISKPEFDKYRSNWRLATQARTLPVDWTRS